MNNNKIISEIFDWSKAILFALSISIVISAVIVQPYEVSGSSMEPTLDGKDPDNEDKIGDRVMIYKSAYLLGEEPKYNDVVIVDSRINRKRTITDNLLESPIVRIMSGKDDEEVFWIKRVIGEAGDTLEYKDGKVFRNGEELVEEYIKEELTFPFETVVVPENHVFVMGDNRNGSYDSRALGPVPFDNVLGKAIFRHYPFNKFSKF